MESQIQSIFTAALKVGRSIKSNNSNLYIDVIKGHKCENIQKKLLCIYPFIRPPFPKVQSLHQKLASHEVQIYQIGTMSA